MTAFSSDFLFHFPWIFSLCAIFFSLSLGPPCLFLLYATAFFFVSAQEHICFQLFVALVAIQRPLSTHWLPLCDCLSLCVQCSLGAGVRPPVILTAPFWQPLFPDTLGLLCATNPGQVSLLSCFSVSISANFLTVWYFFSLSLDPWCLFYCLPVRFSLCLSKTTPFPNCLCLWLPFKGPIPFTDCLCVSVCFCVCCALWWLPFSPPSLSLPCFGRNSFLTL